MCNEFNKYFINSARYDGPNLAYHPPEQNNHNFSFQEINTRKMLSIIADLPNKKSTGCDEIQTRIVKDNSEVLAPILTKLFNLMVRTTEYPMDLKIQKITPIHKCGDRHDIKNFRPIAVLPVINKCIEKILKSQITAFLDDSNYLYNLQFGFRSGSNTTSALIDIIDTICKELDDKSKVGGLFLDLRKAFDSINHDILIKKIP